MGGGRGGLGERGRRREKVGGEWDLLSILCFFSSAHWTKHVPNSLVPLTLRNEAGEITART